MPRTLTLLAVFLLSCSGGDDVNSTDGDAGTGGSPASTPDASTVADAAVAGAPTWATLPSLLEIRQEHAVVALEGRVCVIGGFAPGITDTVECYDPSSRSWSPIASLPAPLHHANAAVVDGRILVLGYLSDIAFSPTGTSYAYDPAANAWSSIAAMPAGRERGSAGVATLGSEVYLIGGAQGGAVAFVDIYDAASDTWREGPSLPEPREHLCAGTALGHIVVAGGRSGGITGHTDSVLTLEPSQSTWQARAPMPTSRGGCAGATLAGRFHVFGGEGNAAAPSGVFPDAEAYDPATDSWTVLAPMPVPRHGFGAATLGDAIYLPGGATQQAFGAVSDVAAFAYDGT